jgi:hypothetical protein
MWYKFALTEIEPTGQTVLPGMESGKFDLNQLRFDLSEKDNEYTLNVYVPGSKNPAGYLKFIYNEDTNNIFVDMVAIGEAKFEKSGEDYEMRLRGRGIANKLYEKLLEIIHSDPKLSKAKSILEMQNFMNDSAFNEQTQETQNFVKEKLSEYINQRDQLVESINQLKVNNEEISERLKPSQGSSYGAEMGGDIVTTFHNIPPKPQKREKIEKVKIKDDNQKRLEI